MLRAQAGVVQTSEFLANIATSFGQPPNDTAQARRLVSKSPTGRNRAAA